MVYWSIYISNFEGSDERFLFENEELCRKSFEKLCKKYADFDEFETNGEDECSWFDAGYNEYSTFANIEQFKPIIYNDVIRW